MFHFIRYAALLAALVVGRLAGPALGQDHSPAKTPKAHTTSGTATVGALFDSATSTTHFCTASVVTSPHGDVLVTAAHCIQGSAKGWSFAPDYHNGLAPYGRWTVTGAYLDPQWVSNQSPLRDYAFLTVAPRTINGKLTEIQAVTGSNQLDTNPAHLAAGETVTITGHPAGTDNDPLTCTTKVYFDGPYPAFDCDPYVDGTSGSPWLVRTADGPKVMGVIGGLHQGGCYSWTSYSSPLGAHAEAVYAQAAAGDTPDVAPNAGGDGCSNAL